MAAKQSALQPRFRNLQLLVTNQGRESGGKGEGSDLGELGVTLLLSLLEATSRLARSRSYRQTHSRVGSVYRFSPRAKSSGTVQLAKINTHVTSSSQCTRRPGAAAPFLHVQQAAPVHVAIGSDVTVNKQGLSTPLLLSACQDYLALMSFCYGKGKGVQCLQTLLPTFLLTRAVNR